MWTDEGMSMNCADHDLEDCHEPICIVLAQVEKLRDQRDNLEKQVRDTATEHALVDAESGKLRKELATWKGYAEDREKTIANLQEELGLFQTLEGALRERRVMEPKHSAPDHECVECEVFSELGVLRRTREAGGFSIVQGDDREAECARCGARDYPLINHKCKSSS